MSRKAFHYVRNSDGKISHLETWVSGKMIQNNAKLNKSTGFTHEERNQLQLSGRLPYRVETIDEQAQRFYQQYLEQPTNLSKNLYLDDLHNSNETLFYYLIGKHLKEMLPIIYTPTVGEAVEQFSLELRRTRGLYLAYPEKDNIAEMLDNRLNSEVDIIVVTDGEGILGIGDQGSAGIDIPIAKLMVYTLCAGVNPHRVLPIQLDVGTNNERLLKDPNYLGWRHERITGKDYDDFIDTFVSAVQEKFPWVYLHWEDFGRDNARRNLDRYRTKVCSFNDDIQGTGAVALSCALSGVQAAGEELTKQDIVFFGAGTAGAGIADQVCAAMVRQGLSEQEAYDHIWLIDREGLLIDDMSSLMPFQKPYAKSRKNVADWQVENPNNLSLLDVVTNVKPGILIGCSTVQGAFNEQVVKTMASHCKHPIILPLSNPTSKSEATPKDLIQWTDGSVLLATGSPFDDVEYKGKTIRISQSNNALVFPGIGLALVASKAKCLTDNMIWAACQALRDNSPAKNDKHAPLLPDLNDVQKISQEIARAVIAQAVEDGEAEPLDNVDLAINNVSWEAEYFPYKLAD